MKSPRTYFYCRNDTACLQEDVIALAEGLRELGLPFSGNCNYWQESPSDSCLIQHDPEVTPDDADVVVVSYPWPRWIRSGTFDLVEQPLPAGLFKRGRRYRTVYMDSHDGHRTVSWLPEYRQFDLILRSKLNRLAWHPENVRPWVLGLNRRILDATAGARAFGERERAVLVNFGASHPYPHGTRDAAAARFLPRLARVLPLDSRRDDLSREPEAPGDALMWRQTGGRFSRSYYERLKATQAVACFCGDLIPPLPYLNPECYLVGGNRAKLRRAFYEFLGWFDSRPPRAVQWDSFRFWEALAAGCATINLDLEHYGVVLPVMPVKWTHYIGVNLDRVDETIDRLVAESGILESIARAGHDWALQHYSPRALARRFIIAAGLELPAST